MGVKLGPNDIMGVACLGIKSFPRQLRACSGAASREGSQARGGYGIGKDP